jgi:hypothetical protein
MKYLIIICLVAVFLVTGLVPNQAWALKKKVAQSGMTYLAISTSARMSAMGDASVATVNGIEGVFYNPATLADVKTLAGVMNQVNWLVDTKLYSLALGGKMGRWGSLALDLVYMDYGKFVGTQPVDVSVNPRGFIFTGDFTVEDYSVGLSYGYRMSDRFAFGFKVKHIHEDLGDAAIVQIVRTDTVGIKKNWNLNHWGMDFGTIYYTGFKSLAFAMSLRNFSTDMKYWYEEFQLPICLRMGISMDLADFFMPQTDDYQFNVALDATHPNDYLERVHIGAEAVYLKRYALRGGYQFNHDVENFSLGFGLKHEIGGVSTIIDYSFTNADYFDNINRFTIQFAF